MVKEDAFVRCIVVAADLAPNCDAAAMGLLRRRQRLAAGVERHLLEQADVAIVLAVFVREPGGDDLAALITAQRAVRAVELHDGVFVVFHGISTTSAGSKAPFSVVPYPFGLQNTRVAPTR